MKTKPRICITLSCSKAFNKVQYQKQDSIRKMYFECNICDNFLHFSQQWFFLKVKRCKEHLKDVKVI